MITTGAYLTALLLSGNFIVFSSQNELQSLAVEGKKMYEEFSQKISLFGSCWKNALENLNEGCRHLSEEVHSRLALTFANCFLEHSGSKTCPCSNDKKISDCLADSTERIFSTYREFYTHTRSICYFLQHQVWQEKTHHTVVELSAQSQRVSQQLKNASEIQASMIHLQHVSIGKQQLLINQSEKGLRDLTFELQQSRNHARAVMEDFKSSTDEQKLLIYHVFDHVKRLETLMMLEFTGFHAIIYYIIVCVLCYVLTSARQTSDARFWLYLLVTSNIVLERMVVSSSIEEESGQKILLDDFGPVYSKVWLCRKIYIGLEFVVLLICFHCYKDYDIINNKLLLKMEKEMQEILCSVKNYAYDYKPRLIQPTENVITSENKENVKPKEELGKRDMMEVPAKVVQQKKRAARKRVTLTTITPVQLFDSCSPEYTSPSPRDVTPRSTQYNLRPRPSSSGINKAKTVSSHNSSLLYLKSI